VLVVVGSKSSSNSNRLREMADKVGIPGFSWTDRVSAREWFDGAKTVGVTGGASAPEIWCKASSRSSRRGAARGQ